MGSHRTTRRGLIALLLAAAIPGTAQAGTSMPQTITFPVVGGGRFADDYGAPRWQGSHQGNDIMSRRWQPAIAAVNGRIDLHMSSSRTGTCMLYLRHKSGTTYVYIHLNNDLTAQNDNRGGCREGVAYPVGLGDGAFVRRGQLIAYVGDSGDANGIQPHLHFEIRRAGNSPINPYDYLRRARRVLFPRGPSQTDPLALSLTGYVKAVGEGRLDVKVRRVSTSLGAKYPIRRRVSLAVPAGAVVQRATSGGPVPARMGDIVVGQRVTVQTAAFQPYFWTQLASPGTLSVASVLLRS